MKRVFFLLLMLFTVIACNKGTTESNQPHYDITYLWGSHYWDEVWPTDNVAASAGSVLVDNVFLLCDGDTLSGLDVTFIRKNMEKIIGAVSEQNRYKVHGKGNLKHLYITDKADSTWLSQFGFKFVEPKYKNQ